MGVYMNKTKLVYKYWGIELTLANRIKNLADKYSGGVQRVMVEKLLRLGIDALPKHLMEEAGKIAKPFVIDGSDIEINQS